MGVPELLVTVVPRLVASGVLLLLFCLPSVGV